MDNQNKIISLNPTSQPPLTALSFVCSDEKLYNIWTVRITQIGLNIPFRDCLDNYLEDIESLKAVKLAIAFREKSKRGIKHIHLRIVTTWKTRPSLLKIIKKHFMIYGNKGNKIYQTHKCFVDGVMFDKSLLHSTHYIAKEGDVIYKKGYSDLDVANIISESKRYNSNLKLPIYQKIILQYDISTPEKLPYAILEFYESIEKVPPKMIFVREIIRKILWKISPKYRQNYKKKILQCVEEELCEYI